jgi:hypothetical protein
MASADLLHGKLRDHLFSTWKCFAGEVWNAPSPMPEAIASAAPSPPVLSVGTPIEPTVSEHHRLCESHLLPRGVYVRSRGENGTTHFIATAKGERPSQHQYKQHLLCSACEQRFSENGEKYVLGLMNNRDQQFQLLDILKESQVTAIGSLWSQYSAEHTPTIDRKQLAYFAISVFWRASVATWKDASGVSEIRIDLGEKYNEEIRRYLLGETEIPNQAFLVVYVCSDAGSATQSFAPANNGRTKVGKLTGFLVRGIEFSFGIGRAVQDFQRRLSLTNSEFQWIHRDCSKYRMRFLDGAK